jgi:hypothetical protein
MPDFPIQPSDEMTSIDAFQPLLARQRFTSADRYAEKGGFGR